MHIKAWFPTPCQSKLGGIWFRHISFFKSEGPRSLFVMEQLSKLPSAGHFLDLFVALRNTSKTASYHWSREGLKRAGRPSRQPTPHYTLLRWPHTPCVNHTSHFPSVRLLPVYTPFSFSSTHLAVPASTPSILLSFLPTVAHPSPLSALHQSCSLGMSGLAGRYVLFYKQGG